MRGLEESETPGEAARKRCCQPTQRRDEVYRALQGTILYSKGIYRSALNCI
jgi:hypothetical protein